MSVLVCYIPTDYTWTISDLVLPSLTFSFSFVLFFLLFSIGLLLLFASRGIHISGHIDHLLTSIVTSEPASFDRRYIARIDAMRPMIVLLEVSRAPIEHERQSRKPSGSRTRPI